MNLMASHVESERMPLAGATAILTFTRLSSNAKSRLDYFSGETIETKGAHWFNG
jgi:hypothetical protein